MGGEQAAAVLVTVKRDQLGRDGGTLSAEDEDGHPRSRSSSKYEREGSPYYSTARLWDDGVIDPVRTRRGAGARAVGSLQRARPGTTRFGVFRM